MIRRLLLRAVLLCAAGPAAAQPLHVEFSEVPGAEGYYVSVRQVPTPWPVDQTPWPLTPTPVTPGVVGAAVPVGRTPGAVFEVRVSAFDAEQESAASNVLSIAVPTWTEAPTETPTPTATVTATLPWTMTATATDTATATPTDTVTATATDTATETPTATPTATETATATATATATETVTATATATHTPALWAPLLLRLFWAW